MGGYTNAGTNMAAQKSPSKHIDMPAIMTNMRCYSL